MGEPNGSNGNGRKILGVSFEPKLTLSGLITIMVVAFGGYKTVVQIEDNQAAVVKSFEDAKRDLKDQITALQNNITADVARLDRGQADTNHRIDILMTRPAPAGPP